MNAMGRATIGCSFAASFALVSCAGVGDAGSNPLAASSLAKLLPGPRLKVVEVREDELEKLPTGHQRALAFENDRRRGFRFFGGPVDFKEPDLPAPGAEMDGTLLPPRMP